jgi:lipoyl-dependent peroxiredoxin
VPRVQRSADVTWEGNVARGSGTISAGTGAFDGLGLSLATRVGAPEGKTSPEELLAAAHAGCYAMSLASELTQAGTPPERLVVTATVTLDEVDGGSHRIVSSQLHAQARGEGIDAASLEGAARAADDGCPFSALINASGTVAVDVELEGGTDGD